MFFYESIIFNGYSRFGMFHSFSMKAARYISFLQNSFPMPVQYTTLFPLCTLVLSVPGINSRSEFCHQQHVF